MWRNKKYIFWFVMGVVCCQHLCAQNNGTGFIPFTQPITDSAKGQITTSNENPFIIRHIVILGNKKTRNDIILREIPFKEGETYLLPELVNRFEIARRQLMNTTLFHEAIVALKSFEGYNIDILVELKERWYIFPLPFFKPVDRNLNQWLIEQKASFRRVNYGGKLLYNNVTGRNDKLRLWMINGYTKQLAFSYDRLYIDKRMKWGMNLSFAMGKNREINFKTFQDRQSFLKADNYIRSFITTAAELTYRKAIFTRHRFGVGFIFENVDDTVLKLNPNYFNHEKKNIRFPELYYNMTYYNVDYIPYPTRGYAAEVMITKKGLSRAFNLTQLAAKGLANWPAGIRSFISLNFYGTVKLPLSQPYYTQRLLGYNDIYMQGYEYYVVDGVAGGYLKASFTRKMVKFNIKIPDTKMLVPQKIPFNVYARIFGNTGYVYHPDPDKNNLPNQMLYSAGMGIDITTIYDFTFRIDWSFNQLGQNGIFLHKKVVF